MPPWVTPRCTSTTCGSRSTISSVTKGAAACVWTGRGQAFLIGAEPPDGLAGIAALTDQSDAWVVLRLAGPALEDVLRSSNDILREQFSGKVVFVGVADA